MAAAVGLGGALPAILFFPAGRVVAAESKAPAGPGDPIVIFDAALARGDAGAALQAARAAADWRRRTLAEHPKDLATSLDLLAGRVFQEAGGTSESESLAEMLFREALEIRRRVFGADSLEAAGTLDTLSSIHFFQGRFDEAEAEEREVLRQRERLLPEGDPQISQARDGLGTILYKEGRYAEAEPLLSKALDHYLKDPAIDAGRIADTLNVLGELARSRGDFAAAEERYRRGIAAAGGEAPSGEAALRAERARLLNSLAGLYKDEGRYDEADDLLRRSLALREKAEPPDQADLATAWLNLAEISRLQGVRDEAERRYARALELARPALGPDNPELAWFLGQTAVLSSELGRYDAALSLETEAIDLLRRTLGEEHFQTAQALHDLGRLDLLRGRPSDALPPLRQALLIRTKVYGDSHPEVALTRIELARALAASIPAPGRPAPEGAAAASSPTAAEASQEIDDAIATLAAGVAYPESLAEAHAVRADLRRRAGDSKGAIADLQEMARVVETLRPRSGSEAARAGFMSKYAAWYDQMVLDLLRASRIDEAFAAAERGRSRALLDQMALAGVDLLAGIPEPRRSALTAREAAAGGKLAELQERIAVMRGRTDLTEEERRRRVATLDAELAGAARDYADVYGEIRTSSTLWRATAGSPPVALAEAQESVIAPGGAMLLYVIGEEESAVLVVPAGPARSAASSWQPLTVDEAAGATLGLVTGPLRAADLNRILRGETGRHGLLAALSRPPQRGGFEESAGGADADEALNALWRILLPRTVWDKIKGATEVVVLPDGSLHGLPFEALVVKQKTGAGRDRYWLDDGPPLRYAASATLMRDAAGRPAVTDPRLLSVSDPIYDPKTEGRALHPADDSALRDSFARAGGALVRLPGTARETEAIVSAFGPRVTVLQGADADEARVRAALKGAGHRYLHLAVHGLVDKEMGYLFAALALTPPAASPVVRPRPENDGFLQLFEIYDLDLRSELAVLSACGTQSGREVEGEGVFALSRGFLTAGSRRVIASQWSVDDASTAILMGGLFTGLASAETKAKSGPPYAAILRDAKRAVRARPEWASPFYWAPFVLTGAR